MTLFDLKTKRKKRDKNVLSKLSFSPVVQKLEKVL